MVVVFAEFMLIVDALRLCTNYHPSLAHSNFGVVTSEAIAA